MKKYHVGDRTVVLIEGELFEKLLPLGDLPVPTEELPKRRGRPKGLRQPKPKKAFNTRLSETRERKRRNVLGPEAEETIKAELAAGMGLGEACKKYEISVSTFYRLKNESRSKPVVEE